MKTCPDYCGVTCVNGSCPNALREEYFEYSDIYPEKIKCNNCFYNEGCKDCYFYDNPKYPCERKDKGMYS